MILPVIVFQDKFLSRDVMINNDIYFCLYRDYDQVVSRESPQQISQETEEYLHPVHMLSKC